MTQLVDDLFKEHPDWSSGMWARESLSLLSKRIKTKAPLPTWTELVLERMMDSWVAQRTEDSFGDEAYRRLRYPEGYEGSDSEDELDESDWEWDGNDAESE
jgi:hypothetical protein